MYNGLAWPKTAAYLSAESGARYDPAQTVRIFNCPRHLHIDGVRATLETVLHSFEGKPAEVPLSGLASDTAGNLYGVTASASCQGCHGVAFELSEQAAGTHT